MQSGIISSNKSEKFNSFISSWGDINISTKNSKACIKTIKATTIDNEILIVIDAYLMRSINLGALLVKQFWMGE